MNKKTKIARQYCSGQNIIVPVSSLKSNAAYTLLEILLVVTVIMILVSMLLPAMKNVREQARAIQCTNNMKQFGQAFAGYSVDFNDFICPYNVTGGGYWFRELLQYYLDDKRDLVRLGGYYWAGATRIDSKLACPSVIPPESGARYSYGLNQKFSSSYPDTWYTKTSRIRRPSRGCLLAEVSAESVAPICFHFLDGPNYIQWFPHHQGENILFFDFHVDRLKRIKIPDQARDSTAWKSSFWAPVDWTNDSW